MATHILILDQSPELLALFQSLLEEEGYELTLSVLPIQRVDIIEQINPDLILLDFLFSKERLGQHIMEMLQERLSTRDIPLILCSADERALQQLHPYLIQQHISIVHKPFDLSTLLDTINLALPPSKRLQ